PAHPIRRRFDATVSQFITRLKSSPEMQQKLEGFKQELIGHPMVEEMVASVWDHARATAANYRNDPESSSLEPLEQVLAGVAESMATNHELRAEVDHFAIDAIVTVLEQNRDQAANMIADTVAGWDPKLAAERIELAVGRDLQFVRLNGTLVGGLAGLVIYTLMRWV